MSKFQGIKLGISSFCVNAPMVSIANSQSLPFKTVIGTKNRLGSFQIRLCNNSRCHHHSFTGTNEFGLV